MKRFFVKVGHFFWSWGFLKFVLWTITLVILFYVEEDWRGARAWAATKAEWEAKGESFDPNKFIPPPVPDEQNLGALPAFKLEWVKGENGVSYLYPFPLQRELRSKLPGNTLPPQGNWQKGELPDMTKVRSSIALDYAEAFKGVIPPGDALAQFEALYPFLSRLRTEAAKRPYFNLVMDYSVSPSSQRALGQITEQIALCKVLKIHALLALDQGQPGLALEDVRLNIRLASGVARDPSLVAGLVAIGMTAIFNPVISYGLTLHAWDDAQLADIQSNLGRLDFLSIYQSCMRGAVATEVVPNFDYAKLGTRKMRDAMVGVGFATWMDRLPSPMADGWLDQNKCQLVTVILTNVHNVDPASHRIFPAKVNDLSSQIERLKENMGFVLRPWNTLFMVSAGPLLGGTSKFAQAQVYVDEARIACALERYRLVHQAYPGSLDNLAPDCISEVPHDVINGEPYHYRLNADGTYLLYSVGWNQTDDGGNLGYFKASPTAMDYSKGDWVWPTPQSLSVKSNP